MNTTNRGAPGVGDEEAPRICVLDYGMGNLRSVEKALERVGAGVTRTSDFEGARAAKGLVLPGVGAFPAAMARVRELGLDTLIAERLEAGTPVLGICLGMQLIFEASSEGQGAEGLRILSGEVEPLDAPGLKVPHIGWSPVSWERRSPLVDGLEDGTPFYFVHSFTPWPADREAVLGTAEYGESFVCAVERPPLYAVQFHPEKSSVAGLRLLENFASICARATALA